MPPAPLLLACSLLDVFEISLLKCVLARWCLDAVSTSRVCKFMVNVGADSAKFGAQTCHLACLGGHRANQGNLGAHGRRPWRSRLGFLSILEGFRGRHLDVFGQLWHNNCVFWHACLQVTFFEVFGVWIWMSGAPESSIWCWKCCKNQLFTHVGILLILVSFWYSF